MLMAVGMAFVVILLLALVANLLPLLLRALAVLIPIGVVLFFVFSTVEAWQAHLACPSC